MINSPPRHTDERLYAAVGIPQGVLLNKATGEVAGAVRRDGDVLTLDPTEYPVWAVLLAPMTAATLATVLPERATEPLLVSLTERRLVVALDPTQALSADVKALRPLPLAVGLGNCSGDATAFELQNGDLSLPDPVRLNFVEIMAWWEVDGGRSLSDIVAFLASRFSDLSEEQAGIVVTQLVYRLMAHRLLYLDGPIPSAEE